jgi:hypothetical protein
MTRDYHTLLHRLVVSLRHLSIHYKFAAAFYLTFQTGLLKSAFMDLVALTVGLSWLFTGALCILLSLPLIKRKIPRNSFYGMRFPQSYQSDEAWFKINEFGGKQMLLWSLLIIAAGTLALFLPLQGHPARALFIGLFPLVFILTPVLLTWRFARRGDKGVW